MLETTYYPRYIYIYIYIFILDYARKVQTMSLEQYCNSEINFMALKTFLYFLVVFLKLI